MITSHIEDLKAAYVIVFPIFFFLNISVSAELSIAKPFPPVDNYPVELESFEITCIAFDPAGVVIPQKIEFIRTDVYSTERVVMENGRIEFTNRSVVLGNGTKLFVTLHIRNITIADDSQQSQGRYKCKAYGVVGNSTVDAARAFRFNVLRRHEIPRLAVPSEFVLQHGQKAVIKSNLTYRGSGAPLLTKLSWFNGDKLLKTNEDPTAGALPAFVIQNPGLEDVGNYRCVLGVMLRRQVAYNVTAETTVKIAPWFEKNEGSKVVNQGQSVELECSARGIALSVEWKIKRKTDKTVKTISGCFNSSSLDSRYKISPKGSHGQSVMTIKNVKIADTGNYYYCCLPSKCSNIIEKHRCQKFTLLLESAGAKTKASLSVLLGVVAFFALGLNF
ncbi:PREDICTED: neural cell adhesion molecule 2-like isoform X2 [Acropora digitifera]|uniref:neural cell adhesion molecule 2-like isoform X2 n=1 Tax=Acropora digitifera TaxID=70779 RepID=UPI00077A26A3|nr:PREDICTED: neural cell adhesion molecule 2-like isoform X2 [Acropora digitifera]